MAFPNDLITLYESSSNPTRSIDEIIIVSDTYDAFVSYTVQVVVPLAVNTGYAGAQLQISPDGSTWTNVASSGTAATISVLGFITVNLLSDETYSMSAFVPAGWRVRIVAVSPIIPTASYNIEDSHEMLLGVNDDRSIHWTTDRDPTTAPVTTSHNHLDGLDVVDELTIDQYKRDPSESYRNFSGSTTTTDRGDGYVRGTDLHVKGQKSDGDMTVSVEYRGTTYTQADSELTFPTSTTWEWIGPAGAETSPSSPEQFDVSSTAGAIPKFVEFIVDRTAPSVSLSYNATHGSSSGDPLLRGEYARWIPTYSDGNSGVGSASYNYQHGSYWTSEPSNAGSSGASTGWVRSAAGAPTSGDTDITLNVEDNAGNTSSDTITVFFGALPAVPTVTVDSIDSGNERPAHLNNSNYAQTSYDDNQITATVGISPTVSECRNSANDDTQAGIRDGSLLVSESYVQNVDGLTSVQDSVSVPNQSERIASTIRARVTDQHYRNTDSTAVGDFAYNPNRSDDYGQDQDAGNPSLPFTGKVIEPITDENPIVSLTNAQVLGGRIDWLSSTAEVEIDVATAANNGSKFRPRLIDTNGLDILYSTYGSDLDVEIWDGSQYVTADTADTFGPNCSYDIAALNSATSVQIKISRLTSSGPDVAAIAMNFVA